MYRLPKGKNMFERNHKPEWTDAEKQIIKDNINLSYQELAQLLPERSLSAIKNRVKQIKFGKYHAHSKRRY